MTRTRSRSDRSLGPWAFGLLVLSACGQRPPDFPTTGELSDEPRHAPGVAVDPAPELPPPRAEADTESGLVSLDAPADPERARDVVREFFSAIARSSYDDLEPLLDEQAWVNGGSSGGRQRARSFWQMRLSRLDYGSLAGQVIFREADLETYSAKDVNELRPPRALPMSVQGDDVLIKVPVAVPRTGRTRLFGDEIAFLLRPSGTGFVIVEMLEEFQIP